MELLYISIWENATKESLFQKYYTFFQRESEIYISVKRIGTKPTNQYILTRDFIFSFKNVSCNIFAQHKNCISYIQMKRSKKFIYKFLRKEKDDITIGHAV